jgi:hypothetical protein
MPPQAVGQGPVTKQVPVEEDLVVEGLLGVDPGALCRGRGHAGRLRQPRGLTWRVYGRATKVVESRKAIPAQTGRVDDWRGNHRFRGVAVAGGFRPCRCLNPGHSPLSSRRATGSVRGALGNGRFYRERRIQLFARSQVAVFFQAAMATIYVAIAVITYPIVKMDSRNGALAYFAFRIIGAAFLFVGIVTLLLLLALGRLFAQAGASNVPDFEMIGALFRQARDWLNHIGMILPWSIGGVFLYLAFLRTKLIPRWLSISGLVGTALTLVATILYMLDQIQIVTITYFALNVPTALFEITLALYLIARGFRQISPSWTPSPNNRSSR